MRFHKQTANSQRTENDFNFHKIFPASGFIEMFSLFFGGLGNFLLKLLKVFYGFLRKQVLKAFLKLKGFIKLSLKFIESELKSFFKICLSFKNEFRHVVRAAKKAKTNAKFSTAVIVFIARFLKITFSHGKVFKTLFNYSMPVISLIIFSNVIGYFNYQTYGLEVTYNGKHLGYVKNEETFDNASKMVSNLLLTSGDAGNYIVVPSYSLQVIKPSEIIDASTLADKLIENSGGVFENACGLYIDERFVGALKNESDVRGLLDEILKRFKTGYKNANVKIANQVELKLGLYPKQSVLEIERLSSILMGDDNGYSASVESDRAVALAQKIDSSVSKLYDSNTSNDHLKPSPVINIKVTRQETYEVSVPFETQKVDDNSKYTGYSKTIVAGTDGQARVTASVSYVDGKEVSREELNREIITPPTTQKILMGTKVPTKAESLASKEIGRFIWPVDGGYVSSGFEQKDRPGHKALDIAASAGTDIFASDSGVVELAAATNDGAGLNIIVNHGDGYKTRYAHCSKLYVSAGQRVIKGQIIAAVGRTGLATGNHCHFEIIYNGTKVNPAPFLEN